jgi:hypothetical protein
LIEAPTTTKESIIKHLDYLLEIIESTHDDVDPEEYIHEPVGIKKARLSQSFLDLGGLYRSTLIIENHMDDPEFVHRTSEYCGEYLWLNPEYSFLKRSKHEACKVFYKYDGFRSLVRVVEELLPSDTGANLKAVASIFRLIRMILAQLKSLDLSDFYIVMIVEMNIGCLTRRSDVVVMEKIQAMNCFTEMLVELLLAHKTETISWAVKTVLRRALRRVLKFYQRFKTEWLEELDDEYVVLRLCAACVRKDIFSVKDLLNWMPLVTEAALIDPADDAFHFFEKVLGTVEHSELDKTNLWSTLASIARSERTCPPIKTKSRDLMKKLMP